MSQVDDEVDKMITTGDVTEVLQNHHSGGGILDLGSEVGDDDVAMNVEDLQRLYNQSQGVETPSTSTICGECKPTEANSCPYSCLCTGSHAPTALVEDENQCAYTLNAEINQLSGDVFSTAMSFIRSNSLDNVLDKEPVEADIKHTNALSQRTTSSNNKGRGSISFDEMCRLMSTYGSTKCLRKRKASTSSSNNNNNNGQSTAIKSTKRKFYRWFPNLESRFTCNPTTGRYEPNIGHEAEIQYRLDMRKKDGMVSSKKRAKSRKERNTGVLNIDNEGDEVSSPHNKKRKKVEEISSELEDEKDVPKKKKTKTAKSKKKTTTVTKPKEAATKSKKKASKKAVTSDTVTVEKKLCSRFANVTCDTSKSTSKSTFRFTKKYSKLLSDEFQSYQSLPTPAGILSACVHFIITGDPTTETTADVEAILDALEEDNRVLGVSVSISTALEAVKTDLIAFRKKCNDQKFEEATGMKDRYQRAKQFITSLMECSTKDEMLELDTPWNERIVIAQSTVPGRVAAELTSQQFGTLPRGDQVVVNVNNMNRVTATSNLYGQRRAGDTGMSCPCGEFEVYRSSTAANSAQYQAAKHLSSCKSLPKDQLDQLITFGTLGVLRADWAIIRDFFLQEEIDNVLCIVAGEKAVLEPMKNHLSKLVDIRMKLFLEHEVPTPNPEHQDLSKILLLPATVEMLEAVETCASLPSNHQDKNKFDVGYWSGLVEAVCELKLEVLMPGYGELWKKYKSWGKQSKFFRSIAYYSLMAAQKADYKSGKLIAPVIKGINEETNELLPLGPSGPHHGFENDHPCDDKNRVLSEDERTKTQNVSDMLNSSIRRIVGELSLTMLVDGITHNRRANKACQHLKNPNTGSTVQDYGNADNIRSMKQVIESRVGRSIINSGIEVRNANVANRSSMSFAQVAQKAWGGYSFPDLTYASQRDYDTSNDNQFMGRTVKVGVKYGLMREADGCAGGCGISFRNMPVENLTGGDLHHVDGGLTKAKDPSTAGCHWSIENACVEYKKCILLCKGCHRLITHNKEAMERFMAMLVDKNIIEIVEGKVVIR